MIEPLSDVFTAPSYEHFKSMLTSTLLSRSKRTVTTAVRLSGLIRSFSNVHRFVSRYVWGVEQLALSVLSLILHYLPAHVPLIFAVDDTNVRKTGRKIFGRGLHFNHTAKGDQPKYIFGHNWVTLGFLYRSSLFSKWLCFPLWTKLYVPRKSLTDGHEHHSRVALAVQMITRICNSLQRSMILVVDGGYVRRLMLGCAGLLHATLIGRLRSDAALYELPPKTRKTRRGRPRKYGPRLPKLSVLAQSVTYTTCRLKLYGRMRDLRVHAFTAVWKPADGLIKVLIVHWPRAKRPRYFFCTDLDRSITFILHLVAARWAMETAFKDMKEHLGFGDYQCRRETAVSRSANLTCAALSLLTLWSLRESSQRQPELWDAVPWYPHKRYLSVLDMQEQLRVKSIQRSILSIITGKARKYRKIEQLSALAKLAA
jgi:hypothetical protein